MSLAEELLADLEEDGFDDGELMVIQEETPNELQENALIPNQTGNFYLIYYLHTHKKLFFKSSCRF